MKDNPNDHSPYVECGFMWKEEVPGDPRGPIRHACGERSGHDAAADPDEQHLCRQVGCSGRVRVDGKTEDEARRDKIVEQVGAELGREAAMGAARALGIWGDR